MAKKRLERGSAAVEQACLKRATGYEVTETKREYRVNEEGELELTKATEQVKHIPGDLKAVEFWLTNREPERWSKSPSEAAEQSESGVIVLGAAQAVDAPPGPAESLSGERDDA